MQVLRPNPSAVSRPPSPRATRPDFRENSVLEERDKSGKVVARFRWGRLLGRGGFAKCYEVTDVDGGATWACKVIDRSSLSKPKTLQKLHSEIAIHRRMRHPNIVQFIKSFQDEWYVYILLEKCANLTLMEVSKLRSRFSVSETQHIMLQTVSAMMYMHQEGVIHRDLKLGNMMMDVEMNVKVGDFGLAAELTFDGERKRTICGTPNYIAPEILEGSREGHSYEADVWSLGVILYTLLIGEPPFQTADVKTTYNRIKTCRYSFPPHITISDSAKDLIHQMLQSRPDRRPSLVQIRSHPFFASPVPPTAAPTTMFTEVQRRRLEQIRGDKGREALRPLWEGNHPPPPPPSGAPPAVPSAPTSTRPSPREAPLRPRGDDAAAPTAATAAAASARGRTSSVPSRPAAGGAGAVNVNGWCDSGRPSRPPSPPRMPATVAPTMEDEEERGHFTAVHDQLHHTFHGNIEVETAIAAPRTWVTEYADFSAKYGLAYKLNTGHVAVHFNDSTKMVWEPITNRVEYYARVREVVNGVTHAQDQRQTFHMDTFPEALNKKVTLIRYFKSYLTKTRTKKDGVEVVPCSTFNSPAQPLLTEPHMVSDMVYVKRWVQTRQAMVFRLSNKCIQVAFFDRAEVILSSESKVVTYTDIRGQRTTLPLASVPSSNEELSSRLHYTKEILCKLINNRDL